MHTLYLSLILLTPGDDLPIAKEPVKEAECSCVTKYGSCQCASSHRPGCREKECPAMKKGAEKHEYRWVRGDDAYNQVALYDGKTQIGCWRYDSPTYETPYWPYDAKTQTWAKEPSRLPHGAPFPPSRPKKANNVGHPLEMPVPECQS